jgi:hypothetical protein
VHDVRVEITTIPHAVRDGLSSTTARTAEPVPWSAEDELRPDRKRPLSAASPSSGNTNLVTRRILKD